MIWRTRNIDLSDYEVAEALDVSLQFVVSKNRAKIFKNYRPKVSPYDDIVTKVCLERFDDSDWLRSSLVAQGFANVTEATRKNQEDMLNALEALGNFEISPIDIQIYNKIYNLYIKHKHSIQELSEILKLSEHYIKNCLRRYKLPSNNSIIAGYDPHILRMYRQIRYYTPETVRLKDGGILILGPHRISVTMSTKVTKRQSTRYRINDVTENYQWLPKIVPDYDNSDPDVDYPHWTIKTIIANPIEKRVAALRLLNYALKCKDRWPKHPIEVIKRCVDCAIEDKTLNLDDFWKIVEHYFGNEELRYYAERPSQMFHILTDATNGDNARTNQIITSRSLTEYLYRKRLRIGYLSPINIDKALRNMNITGPVYDPYPGIGCLAIACSRLGIKYYYGNEDHIFNRGIENGFVQILGDNCQPYNNQQVNYLISQNLPVTWYPYYGQKAKLWSMVNGGNTHHLKLGIQTYRVAKALKSENALRIVNFIPNEFK